MLNMHHSSHIKFLPKILAVCLQPLFSIMIDKTIPLFKLIGIKLPHRTTNHNGQSNKDCGELWQAFEKQKISQRITNKTQDSIYAVYYDYESNELGEFSYFIGCPVETDSIVPDGLDELMIPKQHYQLVKAKGKMPQCIGDAWQRIWSSPFNRQFGYDFEVYDHRSADWSNAEVDIYLSVKG